MTNYNELSDFEINKRVKLLDGSCFTEHVSNSSIFVGCDKDPSGYRIYDPCNNPADAWPIIVESKISVWSQGSNSDLWCAFYQNEESLKSVSAKPLRAAMIVFLMMNENENGPNSTVELVEN